MEASFSSLLVAWESTQAKNRRLLEEAPTRKDRDDYARQIICPMHPPLLSCTVCNRLYIYILSSRCYLYIYIYIYIYIYRYEAPQTTKHESPPQRQTHQSSIILSPSPDVLKCSCFCVSRFFYDFGTKTVPQINQQSFQQTLLSEKGATIELCNTSHVICTRLLC